LPQSEDRANGGSAFAYELPLSTTWIGSFRDHWHQTSARRLKLTRTCNDRGRGVATVKQPACQAGGMGAWSSRIRPIHTTDCRLT